MLYRMCQCDAEPTVRIAPPVSYHIWVITQSWLLIQGVTYFLAHMEIHVCRANPILSVEVRKSLHLIEPTQSESLKRCCHCHSIVSWDENPDTRWYFRCFDVKPLADIIDFHREYSTFKFFELVSLGFGSQGSMVSFVLDLLENLDINECYATFLKTLKNYLDGYVECRDNYYFLFYDGKVLLETAKKWKRHYYTFELNFFLGKLSSSMPQLVEMIKDREGRVGFHRNDVQQTL